MRRLFVLRPEPGASETVERARALGVDAAAMPLFEIEPLEWAPPDPGRFDALLLTSANAVRHGGAGLKALRGLAVHAVGEATAEAARQAGFAIASSGDSGVDRLLESIDPQLRLLHLSGEHYRQPKAGRQEILRVPVYRSAALPFPDGLERLAGAVAAVHSPRAGSRLGEIAAAARFDRSTVRIAAISAAAAAAAGKGWERVEAAPEANDRALLALAARLCEKGGE